MQAHHTRSPHILTYMVARLEVSSGNRVLEPCAGEGHFIDAILRVAPAAEIDAYELDDRLAAALHEKYSGFTNVRVIAADTVEVAAGNLLRGSAAHYDRIIANPPYGAWQDYSRRRWLRRRYPGLYVRETYAVFLYQCIDLLAKNGRLVFIVPDTYLYLRLHEKLRRQILSKTLVEEIVIFPPRFFGGISFGYANLSVITLVSREVTDDDTHKIRVIRNLRSPDELALLIRDVGARKHWQILEMTQNEVNANPGHAFLLPEDSGLHRLLRTGRLTVGDIADVVTGFYSGDDRRWLRCASRKVGRTSAYQAVDTTRIASNYGGSGDLSVTGITGPKCFIPIVKGGAKPYVKPTEWYVDWSTTALQEYTKPRPNKARFQNSRFYFQEGVALPMVSSKRATAALLENRLFDQSIVGIFPHEQRLLLYLLGFFNSGVCMRLLRTINPSANNSANYVKKLPFVWPSDHVLGEVSALVENVVLSLRSGGSLAAHDQKKVDSIFERVYRRELRQAAWNPDASFAAASDTPLPPVTQARAFLKGQGTW